MRKNDEPRNLSRSIRSFASISAIGLMLISLVVLGLSQKARAEKISQYVIESALTDDDVLKVEETFTVDFGDKGDYAIYRIIPIVARLKDTVHRYQFKLDEVLLDEDPNHFNLGFDNANAILQLGGSNRLLKGKHSFSIRYSLRKIATYSPAPTINWDSLGEGWPYPLSNVSVTMQLPRSAPAKKANIKVTRLGSGREAATLYQVNGNEIQISLPRVEAGEGVLLSLNLPEGSITRPEWEKQLGWFLLDWWQAIILPLLAYCGLTAVRWTCDRIQEAPHLVADDFALPEYLTPAELGALLDNRCELPDIVASLFHLAARGYLRIIEERTEQLLSFSNRDYQFVRLKPIDDIALEDHEKVLLEAIFADDGKLKERARLSEMKNSFHRFQPLIEGAVYKQLINKNQWLRLPKEIVYSYFGAGTGLLAIGLIIALFFKAGISPTALGFVGAGLITYSFAPTMPVLTIAGCKSLRQTKMFRGFLLTATDAQIEKLFHGDANFLGRFFAYAVVLGAADKLVRVAQDVLTSQPSWYSPYNILAENKNFSSEGFVSNLGSGMRTIERSFSLSAVTDMSERAGES